jgi:hypothetical protein
VKQKEKHCIYRIEKHVKLHSVNGEVCFALQGPGRYVPRYAVGFLIRWDGHERCC